MSALSGSMGAVMGSDAQTSAANTAAMAQINAALIAAQQQNIANIQQKQIYDEMRADIEPYRKLGVNVLPTLQEAVTGKWEPNQSPAAKYQLRQGNLALMRGLGARGLAGSGLAPSKLAELSSQVAGSDYQNQYNRLLDLVKIGTGASASTGGAAGNLSNAYGQSATNMGNLMSGVGNSLSNLYTQSGAAKASLYSGLGSASANTINTGMKLYDYGQNAGWWGGTAAGIGGTAATNQALYSSAADEGAAWALI